MHGTPSRVLLSRETTQRCACQRWRQWTNRAARPTWVVLFFGLILPLAYPPEHVVIPHDYSLRHTPTYVLVRKGTVLV